MRLEDMPPTASTTSTTSTASTPPAAPNDREQRRPGTLARILPGFCVSVHANPAASCPWFAPLGTHWKNWR